MKTIYILDCVQYCGTRGQCGSNGMCKCKPQYAGKIHELYLK